MTDRYRVIENEEAPLVPDLTGEAVDEPTAARRDEVRHARREEGHPSRRTTHRSDDHPEAGR